MTCVVQTHKKTFVDPASFDPASFRIRLRSERVEKPLPTFGDDGEQLRCRHDGHNPLDRSNRDPTKRLVVGWLV